MSKRSRKRKRSRMVLNTTAAVVDAPDSAADVKPVFSYYETVVANLGGAKVRFETFEGKRHMVVPMVMLVEGVHNGSQGPLLYKGEELGKTPAVWNHKPVVINHPEIDNKPVSACSPGVLKDCKVGVVFNTERDSTNRLKAEAWLDVVRLEEQAPNVNARLKRGETIEISTGLWSDMVPAESGSVWNGEAYVAEAQNFRPDHLAILPDTVGACSVADGGGLLRNAEMSHSDLRDALSRILGEQFGAGEDSPSPWVADVFGDRVVFEHGSKLKQVGFAVEGTNVSLQGDPEEVTRVVSYVTANGEYIGNATVPEESPMDKTKLVEGLIANSKTQWSNDDRDWLMAQDEKTLNRMTPVAAEAPTTVNTAAEEITPKTPVAAEEKPQTLAEYLANAPAEIRPALGAMTRSYAQERTKLVEGLMANERCPFTKEQLEAKDVDELQALTALAGSVQPSQPANLLALADHLDPQRAVANTNTAKPTHEPLGLSVVTFGPAN